MFGDKNRQMLAQRSAERVFACRQASKVRTMCIRGPSRVDEDQAASAAARKNTHRSLTSFGFLAAGGKKDAISRRQAGKERP